MQSLEEWFEPAGSYRGIQKILLALLRWDDEQQDRITAGWEFK
jgi:hypothetical protein